MSTSVVSIADCSVSQIVGQETFQIATGALSLEQLTDESLDAVLLLKVGDTFALPVEKDAIVGTKGDRSYVFSKKLAPTSSTTSSQPVADLETGESDLKDVPLETESEKAAKLSTAETVLLVQIDMPATASESNLTRFEKCLVDHQFLLVGPQADADNLSRAFLEWTGIKTKDLQSYTAQKTAGPATQEPTQFSDTTHSTIGGAATGSTTFAEATAKVGETINAGVASIGSFLGSKIGTKGLFSGPSESDEGWKKDTKEAFSDGVESVGIVGSGIADGAKHAGGEISSTTSKLVQHNYGDDAANLKEQVGTTLQNAGSVGLTAVQQTSTVMHGVTAGQAAVAEE